MERHAAAPPLDPELIVFNRHRRYTGVSATVHALLPVQQTQWTLGYCGAPLPGGPSSLSLAQVLALSRRPPPGRPVRLWHVRRDPEMLWGLWARDVLRLPVRLVFTSAAQRRHGALPRALIARMDAVIATTPRAAACVPNTTAVVPHGIDAQRFAPVDKRDAWADSGLPGRWGIGLFGRVRPEKGTDLFVDALIALLPRHPDFSAVITGRVQPQHAAYARALQARIDAAGLGARLRFLGDVPPHEVPLWPQRCLIAVACAREEQFGLTPFEAAATGCAVVCSRTGAFEQLVRPGVDGELVPTGDLPALVAALDDLMSNPLRTLAMGQAARQRVGQDFSIQAEAAGIGRVYDTLFQSAAAGQPGPLRRRGGR